MKRLFTLTLSIIAVLAMWANPIDRNQAAKIAAQYMPNGIAPRLVQNGPRKAAAANAPLYIFSRGEGEGFVVVSGDDSMPAVLAVVESGDYDESKMPPVLIDMIDGWRSMIEESLANPTLSAAARKAPAKKGAYHSADIEPLIQTRWSQDAPYNLKCPLVAGSTTRHAMTGCVPTCVSQIVYYWSQNWENMTQSVKYTTEAYNNASAPITSADIITAGTPYNWDQMANTYDSSSSDESKNAVATLIALIGLDSKVVYRQNNTSGALTQVVPVLRSQFSLQSESVVRGATSDSEWASILIEELTNNRPIAYGGVGSQGGHAFVCDGYRASDDKFHFNMGWGGQYNGYYTITAGNSSSCGGFWQSQQILRHICPTTTVLSSNYDVVFTYDPSFVYNQESTISVTVTNNTTNGEGNLSEMYVMLSPYEPDFASQYTELLHDDSWECDHWDKTVPGSTPNTREATFTFTPHLHTTYNVKIIDSGNKLIYVGSISMEGNKPSEAPDMPEFRPYIITNLDDQTDGHIYTLTPRSVEVRNQDRGYLTYNTATGFMHGADYISSGDQTTQQFAIVKGNKGYYLWNVSAQQFVSYRQDYAVGTLPCVATPNGAFVFENASDNNKPNQWRLKHTDAQRYLQANQSKGVFTGAISNSDSHGSEWFIEAVGQLSDAQLATIQAAVEAYETSTILYETLDLKRYLGTYYSEVDCTTATDGADNNQSWKAWKMTHASAPDGLNLTIKTADGNGSVNTKISNYPYTGTGSTMSTENKCICFDPHADGREYSISVGSNYYIINYKIGTRDYNSSSITKIECGNKSVTSGSNTNEVSIESDTAEPTQDLRFTLTLTKNGGTANVAATTLRVRIVNQDYKTVWDEYKALCDEAHSLIDDIVGGEGIDELRALRNACNQGLYPEDIVLAKSTIATALDEYKDNAGSVTFKFVAKDDQTKEYAVKTVAYTRGDALDCQVAATGNLSDYYHPWVTYEYPDDYPAAGATFSRTYNGKEYVIKCSESNDAPFLWSSLTNGVLGTDVKWYTLQLQDNYCHLQDDGGVKNTGTNNTGLDQMFAFVGNPFDGFRIYAMNAGSAKHVSAANANGATKLYFDGGESNNIFVAGVTTSTQSGNGTAFSLRLKNDNAAYINRYGGYWKFWKANEAPNSVGCCFHATRVAYDVVETKLDAAVNTASAVHVGPGGKSVAAAVVHEAAATYRAAKTSDNYLAVLAKKAEWDASDEERETLQNGKIYNIRFDHRGTQRYLTMNASNALAITTPSEGNTAEAIAAKHESQWICTDLGNHEYYFQNVKDYTRYLYVTGNAGGSLGITNSGTNVVYTAPEYAGTMVDGAYYFATLTSTDGTDDTNGLKTGRIVANSSGTNRYSGTSNKAGYNDNNWTSNVLFDDVVLADADFSDLAYTPADLVATWSGDVRVVVGTNAKAEPLVKAARTFNEDATLANFAAVLSAKQQYDRCTETSELQHGGVYNIYFDQQATRRYLTLNDAGNGINITTPTNDNLEATKANTANCWICTVTDEEHRFYLQNVKNPAKFIYVDTGGNTPFLRIQGTPSKVFIAPEFAMQSDQAKAAGAHYISTMTSSDTPDSNGLLSGRIVCNNSTTNRYSGNSNRSGYNNGTWTSNVIFEKVFVDESALDYTTDDKIQSFLNDANIGQGVGYRTMSQEMYNKCAAYEADKSYDTYAVAQATYNLYAQSPFAMPEACKYYVVKNSATFTGGEMAMYANPATIEGKWKAYSDTDKSFLWMFIPNADGTAYDMRNAYDGRYLDNKTAWDHALSMVAEAPDNKIALNVLSNGQFTLSTTNGTNTYHIHAQGHNNGTGTAGNIWSWNQNSSINNYSAWCIQEVEVDEDELRTAINTQKTALADVANMRIGTTACCYTYEGNATHTPAEIWQTCEDLGDEATVTDLLDVVGPFTDYKLRASAMTLPTGNHFYRIQGKDSKRYVTVEPRTTTKNSTWTKMVEEVDEKSILFLTEDNKWIGYNNGKYIVGTAQARSDYDQSDATSFTFSTTNSYSHLLMKNSASTEYAQDLGSDNRYNSLGRSSRSTAPTTDDFKFQITEITELPVKLSAINGSGWATLYTPVTLTVPDDVEAYTGTEHETKVALTRTRIIPAGESVLLYMPSLAATTTKNFTIGVAEGVEVPELDEDNCLTGTPDTHTKTDGDMTLGKGSNNVVAFRTYSGDYLSGFKAYIPAHVAQNIRMFTLSFNELPNDIQTAIEADHGKEVYDLNGRRVERTTNGIYIINGKKVIIR